LPFGVTYQPTGSYRSAIVSLVAFLVIGFVLLARVPVRRAIGEAGNPLPKKI
jgi:UMF1 family MFS transporter